MVEDVEEGRGVEETLEGAVEEAGVAGVEETSADAINIVRPGDVDGLGVQARGHS